VKIKSCTTTSERVNHIWFDYDIHFWDLIYLNSLYFEVAMSPIPIIRMIVWLGLKVPKKVQAAEPRAKTKPT
jgi:hypothetical protein